MCRPRRPRRRAGGQRRPDPDRRADRQQPGDRRRRSAGCTDDTGGLLAGDQRGTRRPSGGRCDIGAFEQPVAVTGTVVNRIVALVDGDPITSTSEHLRCQRPAPADAARTDQASVLDLLVTQRILSKEIEAQGITISEAEIDRYIDSIRAAEQAERRPARGGAEPAGPDPGALPQADQGRARARAADQPRDPRQGQRLAGGDRTLPQGSGEPGAAESDEQVSISHIVLQIPPAPATADVAAIQARADKIYEELEGGADFAEVAKRESEDGAASAGGKLGTFKKGEMRDELEEAVAGLEPGEVSKPVRADNSIHIVRLDERIGAGTETTIVRRGARRDQGEALYPGPRGAVRALVEGGPAPEALGGDAAVSAAAAGRRLDGRPDRHRSRSHPRRAPATAGCAGSCSRSWSATSAPTSTPPAACARPCASPPGSRPSRCRAGRSPCARWRRYRPASAAPAIPRWPAVAPPTPRSSRRCAWCASGVADALTTAPISKANLVAAGIPVSGHTELLAQLCGGVPVRMMMVGDSLRVALVTTHLALRAVPRRLRRGRRARRRSASPTAPCASASASAARASASPASTRTPASRGSSATRNPPHRPGGAPRPPPRHRRRAARSPPTACSRSPAPATSTPSSACTTTRGWRRSSCCTSPTA